MYDMSDPDCLLNVRGSSHSGNHPRLAVIPNVRDVRELFQGKLPSSDRRGPDGAPPNLPLPFGGFRFGHRVRMVAAGIAKAVLTVGEPSPASCSSRSHVSRQL
jgi:hypothetical protein